MTCCDDRGGSCLDEQFDEEHAERRLRRYRSHGPEAQTRRLIDALADGGIDGASVLDIGAGVGAVHLGLLARGAESATDVDASRSYIEAARDEADRQGVTDRVRHVYGDFATLTDLVEAADLVALDRVVCCYADMPALVGRAAALTRRRLGLVYPRDGSMYRAAATIANGLNRARRDPFRVYVHRSAAVDALAVAAGLVPIRRDRGIFWQTVVFERAKT